MRENSEFRIEKDTIGEIKVPKDAYWGAQTQRAIENFRISHYKMPIEIIKAIAIIKYASAETNRELGLLDSNFSEYIKIASEEIIYSEDDKNFPVDIFQTGSGTSTNMNVNEVISTRANELLTGVKNTIHPIHPNDHVNKGQSSNDVIPSAIRIAASVLLDTELIPKLEVLRESISNKSKQFRNVVKTGRTHLMDAVPISFGQEFSGWERQIENGIERLKSSYPRLLELPIGGTAVGTGINTHPKFSELVVKVISEKTGIQFMVAKNKFEGIASMDIASEVSGHLKTIASSLMKIANDIRLMNSGPNAGIGEITIPTLQPGSSIMPGKVNPVIPEAVRMVCARVIGNDTTITISSSLGEFELNTMLPIIGFTLVESIKLLSNASYLLAKKVIDGIKINRERVQKMIESNNMVITLLSPVLGYEKSAELYKKAAEQNKSIREVVIESELIEPQKLDEILDFRKMISNHD
ncbi:MAG: class II fumarate hydratase [Spirochaetes bacterium]|nr:class II fumarate hydratase [Spirochaetota bacterium]